MPLVLALLWPGIVVNSDTSVFLEAAPWAGKGEGNEHRWIGEET